MYKSFSTHMCTVLRWKVLWKWEMGLENQQTVYFKIERGWEKEN